MSSAQKQSKVGAELSDIITRRVIVGVLLMLCIVPLLTYSSPVDDENEATIFLHELNIKARLDCDYLGRSVSNFRSFMDQLGGDQPFLVALEVSPPRCEGHVPINFSNDDIIEGLRDDALRTISTDPMTVDGQEYSVSASFNMKPYIDQQSIFSIGLLVFVMIMLIALSLQFTGDAQRLVLAPIEKMMSIVNMVAADPLEVYDFKSMAGTGDYETQVVQRAIEKITALLRIGFGVAGAEIISSNMAVEGKGSACLNPMIPGRRVYALFGFCDIHSFDRVTEILEDEIMTFINSVAGIVHDQVARWGGTCNKNLGNAFLMVWRIGDENALADYRGIGRRSTDRRNSERSTKSDDSDSERPANARANANAVKRGVIDLSRIPGKPQDEKRYSLLSLNAYYLINLHENYYTPGLDLLSDKALIGFLKVMIEINRDVQLLAYRDDERLSMGKENGFSVRMGFGLHAGWAIEGAVGSLQKVDATYLSPHVNMAARMEAASRQFGVSLLMTRSFHKVRPLTYRSSR
jgi:class 3 adenylate cyclase